MSHYLVSFDPGLRCSGVAMFRNSALWHSGLARNAEKHLRGPGAWKTMGDAVEALVGGWMEGTTQDDTDTWEFVSEVPQVYSFKGLLRVDPDDLIQLAGVVGVVTGLFPGTACGYLPREWKKNIPKEVHNRWIRKRLSVAEQAVITDAKMLPSLEHNAVDAVGIGLFHLMRLRIGVKGKDIKFPPAALNVTGEAT